MARIRTIKPQFWGSGDVAKLSREARLLAIGLISAADDEGRFLASPAALIGYVYPNDDDVTAPKLKRWIGEIEAAQFAHFYTVDHVRYGVIPNYRKHQRISHPTPSPLPAPPPEGLFA